MLRVTEKINAELAKLPCGLQLSAWAGLLSLHAVSLIVAVEQHLGWHVFLLLGLTTGSWFTRAGNDLSHFKLERSRNYIYYCSCVCLHVFASNRPANTPVSVHISNVYVPYAYFAYMQMSHVRPLSFLSTRFGRNTGRPLQIGAGNSQPVHTGWEGLPAQQLAAFLSSADASGVAGPCGWAVQKRRGPLDVPFLLINMPRAMGELCQQVGISDI